MNYRTGVTFIIIFLNKAEDHRINVDGEYIYMAVEYNRIGTAQTELWDHSQYK